MILGVDPGTTTGLAFWDEDDREVHVWAEQPAVTAVHNVWQFVERGEISHLVCERYDITPNTLRVTRNADPYHVEGALKIHCAIHQVPFIQISRADAKRFATDEKLRALGWFWRGQKHARDATRQLVTHLARTDPEFVRHLREVGLGTRDTGG